MCIGEQSKYQKLDLSKLLFHKTSFISITSCSTHCQPVPAWSWASAWSQRWHLYGVPSQSARAWWCCSLWWHHQLQGVTSLARAPPSSSGHSGISPWGPQYCNKNIATIVFIRYCDLMLSFTSYYVLSRERKGLTHFFVFVTIQNLM